MGGWIGGGISGCDAARVLIECVTVDWIACSVRRGRGIQSALRGEETLVGVFRLWF